MIRYDAPYLECPLCQSADIFFQHSFYHQDHPLSIYQCRKCSFQFMNPPLSDTSLENLYTDSYYSGRAGYSYTDERVHERSFAHVWRARLKTIRTWIKEGNILDIGCSFGGFLNTASAYYAPYGIEISDYAASYAERRNIIVHKGTIDEEPFAENFFSVITMIEVIEHLKNPRLVASYCYSRLKEGGTLIIQTADMNAWQARDGGDAYHYYLPGHVSYFSEENLKMLLRSAGFSRIRVYRPVDFGLLPKLRKMRGSFTQLKDYLRWYNTTIYHLRGYLSKEGVPLTSSMVIYAQK